ncbi:DinB family protein [Pseudomonas sp.]|uniref:DinB family protein n=1 Tax=Pseudomonas sp. TaxID=306 RepID=UPI003D127A32
MINLRTAVLLAAYKQWADQRLYDSLAALPAEEVSKERAGVCKSMLGTLNHVYVVDRIWQAHLQRQPHEFKTRLEVPHPDFAALRAAQQDMNAWFIDWVAGQTEASLAEVIEFAFVSGEQSAMTAGAMLLHVVNHAAYHRGWVVQMYFEIPARPPVADLPVFLTEVYPAHTLA